MTLTYNSLDRITTSTNQLGHSRHYTYDAIGNITSITDENGHTTQYKYSPLSDVVEVIDATGHSTKYTYNAVKQLTALIQYNNITADITNNNAAKTTTNNANSITNPHATPQITTYKRNKKGEVIETISPLGDIVKYTYDGVGNVTSKLDEDHHETLYTYNLANQLERISYADGKTVAFEYNALRQLTKMQDWLGTTTIELDPLGRTTKVTDPGGNEVGYSYNALGQRDKLTYPDGKEVSYEYTPSGKLSKVLAIAGRNAEAATQGISGLGTAAQSISGLESETTTYTYDPLGRLSGRTLPDGTITKYDFNPLGAITSLTHSKANTILDQFKYTYDPIGNITQIEKHRAGIDSDNGVFKYIYDPLNRLVEATSNIGIGIGSADLGAGTDAANTNINRYTYDPLGNRISSLRTTQGTATDTDITYETRHVFNARNQLIKTFESEGAGIEGNSINAITKAYHYDKRGNIIQIEENDKLTATYTYDTTNMMTAAFAQGKGTAEYTYNGFRRRIRKLENLHQPYVAPHAAANKTQQHLNTQPNQGTIAPDLCKDVKYILDMTRPYDNLLMTQGHDTQSFIWGNSLLSASVTGHDGDLYQSHQNINMTIASPTETSIPTSTIYYLQDHLSSPIRLLSDDAHNTSAIAYDEFGVQEVYPMQSLQALQPQPHQHAMQSSPSQPDAQPSPHTTIHTTTHTAFKNPFGFTGYQLDDLTNMHYAQARYYTPTTGRFTAEDPIQDQHNWYGYCNANPITSVDPTGLAGNCIGMLPTFDDGSCNNTFTAQARPTPQAQAQNRPTPPSTPNVQPGTTGTSNQSARGDNDCAARNIAHIDFDQIFCTDTNGFVFAYIGSGGTATSLQNINNIWDHHTVSRIQNLHPAIINPSTAFILDAQSRGIYLRVTSGYRSFAYQDNLFARGRTISGNIVTNARGGQSLHNFGLAIDVVEIRHSTAGNQVAIWTGRELADDLGARWDEIGAIGVAHGFEWGGDWIGFVDQPHFQMTFGHTTADLRERRSQGQVDDDGFVILR